MGPSRNRQLAFCDVLRGRQGSLFGADRGQVPAPNHSKGGIVHSPNELICWRRSRTNEVVQILHFRVHLLGTLSKLYCFSPAGVCRDPNERRIRNLIAVSRIFLSHSSQDNPQAIALRDRSKSEGWDDIFLDNDPENGIHVGDRWELALSEAIAGCEAVRFLFSKNWLGSTWCLRELRSTHEHNKRLFGVLIEPLPRASLPEEVTTTWQTISLVPTDDAETFAIRMPRNGEIVQVPFSARGLHGLRVGLRKAGLDPSFFQWPPPNELDRPPYRGLRPLEAEDAGIFFGRDSAIISAPDT